MKTCGTTRESLLAFIEGMKAERYESLGIPLPLIYSSFVIYEA